MIRNKAVAAVQEVYPAGDAIWQDDPASIHRTQAALDACSAFAERIPHNVQAAKLSDVWPIEQVFMAGLSPWLFLTMFLESRFGEYWSTEWREPSPGLKPSLGQQLWLPGERWTRTSPCWGAWWRASQPGSWPSWREGGVKLPTGTTSPRKSPINRPRMLSKAKFTWNSLMNLNVLLKFLKWNGWWSDYCAENCWWIYSTRIECPSNLEFSSLLLREFQLLPSWNSRVFCSETHSRMFT